MNLAGPKIDIDRLQRLMLTKGLAQPHALQHGYRLFRHVLPADFAPISHPAQASGKINPPVRDALPGGKVVTLSDQYPRPLRRSYSPWGSSAGV